jgi:multicomponent K+:H+ antiporter subunit G
LGTGSVLLASMIMSSALLNRPIAHEIIITVFIVIVSPVTAMLLMRAARYRTRVNEERRRRQRDGHEDNGAGQAASND